MAKDSNPVNKVTDKAGDGNGDGGGKAGDGGGGGGKGGEPGVARAGACPSSRRSTSACR